jgi:hypothetical protein
MTRRLYEADQNPRRQARHDDALHLPELTLPGAAQKASYPPAKCHAFPLKGNDEIWNFADCCHSLAMSDTQIPPNSDCCICM